MQGKIIDGNLFLKRNAIGFEKFIENAVESGKSDEADTEDTYTPVIGPQFREQLCPFQQEDMMHCGDWCPLFGEPMEITKDVPFLKSKFYKDHPAYSLKICKDTLYFDENGLEIINSGKLYDVRTGAKINRAKEKAQTPKTDLHDETNRELLASFENAMNAQLKISRLRVMKLFQQLCAKKNANNSFYVRAFAMEEKMRVEDIHKEMQWFFQSGLLSSFMAYNVTEQGISFYKYVQDKWKDVQAKKNDEPLRRLVDILSD